MNVNEIARLRSGVTGRCSSWDLSGRNQDNWIIEPGGSRILADIRGPGRVTHIWMAHQKHYRHCLLRMTWDNARSPSVVCPLGDFFGLGHDLVNSYQSLYFTASTNRPYQFNASCALNCYMPMPFRERALIELVNESPEPHQQWYYVDYEQTEIPEDEGYFHTEFRRANPFGGWGHEIRVNSKPSNIVNKGKPAWDNNYVILETRGRGHYVGCNLSVTNFQGTWWGEGDDMIWVDGYKWPPDLHGTGSEDYLGQGWCMQPNAFLRNGSSIYEKDANGYQTSYVFHVENPIHFQKEIKVTIENGHGNHLANEMASVAYWFADRPGSVREPPPVAKRMPVLRDNQGKWLVDKKNQCPGPAVKPNAEMKRMKAVWAKKPC